MDDVNNNNHPHPLHGNNNDFILPINVGHECQILMNNNDELRRCQHDAYIAWIRPWQLELQNNYHHFNHHHHHYYYQQQKQQSNKFESPEQLNGKHPCCYRWALLDCLTDSVQKYCPMANTFDSR